MKNILLFLLLFVLSINVLLAQITLDGTTSTATSDSAGITIINIATPNANGLSNNNYTDFNISSSGVVFNNSKTGGDSQLTGNSITGNASITAGSEATLILNQVTSSNASTLSGRAEVVGGSGVGVIIANPNGITCAGCGFINASQVSLVTGTVDNGSLASGIPTFDTINDGSITFSGDVSMDGDLIVQTANGVTFSGNIYIFGDASVTSRDFTNDGEIDIINNFNVVTTNIFYNLDSAIINANNFNITAYYFYNQDSAMINANNLNAIGVGLFSNRRSGSIHVDSFSGTANQLENEGEIIATSEVNFTTMSSFQNYSGGTISTDTFDIDVFNFQNIGSTVNANNFYVDTKVFFENRGATIDADNINITADHFKNHYTSSISANNNLNIVVNDFENLENAAVSASILTVSANDLKNKGDIIADIFILDSDSASADYFANSVSTYNRFTSDENGNYIFDNDATDFVVRAGAILNVPGAFFATVDNFYIYGIINASTLDFYVNSNFYYDNNIDFVWNVGDNLNVLGDAFVTADSFSNYGTISANNLIFSTVGDFNYATQFQNSGTLTTNSFNFSVGGNFISDNGATNFVWNAGDSLIVIGDAAITANQFTNNGAIDFRQKLTLNLAGDFDYINHYGNTSASEQDFTVGGSFSYDDNTTNFVWNAGDSLTVLSDSAITANQFTNNGAIDFRQKLTLNLAGDFDYSNYENTNTSAGEQDFNVGGNFSYDDNTTNFVWNAGDNLTVTGDSVITANQFTNDGALDFKQKLTLNLAGDFDYSNYENTNTSAGEQDFNVGGNFSYDDNTTNFVWNAGDNLTVTGNSAITANQFTNDGALDFKQKLTLNLAGDFDYINHYGNTSASEQDFTVGGSFSYDDNTTNFVWNAGDSLTVLSDSAITANQFTNNGAIDFRQKLTLNLAGDFDYSNYENTNTSAGEQDFNVGGNFSYDDNTTNFVWNAGDNLTVTGNSAITANQFTNNGAIDFKQKLTLNLAGDFDYSNYENTNTTAESLDFNVGGSFSYNDITNFVWNAGDNLTVTGDAAITANQFTNNGAIDFRQKLTLNLAGDFDYSNYENTNTTAGEQDFTVGGNFSYDDNTTNFVWNAGDSLTVLSDSVITANQFTNNGAIDFEGKLTLNLAGDFDYSNYENTNTTAESLDFNVGGNFSYDDNTTNFVWNAGDNLTVTGDSVITANQFTNNGALDFKQKLTLNLAGDFDYSNYENTNTTAESLDFNVGGSFSYNDTTNFVWNAGDSLTVLSDAAITANQFTNDGALDFKQKLTLNLAGDFDYSNYENTNTSAGEQDFTVGGNFSYDDNTTNFVWNAGDSLTVSGNASVIADSYTQLSDINVSGNVYIQVNKNASIDSGASIQSDLLSLQAVEFSNRGSVTSATVAASVDNFNNAINATVSTGNFATEVKNFNNSGTINVGNLGFAIDGSFDNEGSITATNSFNVSVENNFRNSGSINSPSLYVSAGNRVDNYGDLDAPDFLIIEAQGDINNSDINNAANISSISLFINGYGNFTNDNSNIDIEGASVIHAGGEFSNSGNITAEALGIFANEVTNNGVIIVDYLDVSADTVNNTGDITADIFDITANSFTGNNINIR